MEMNKILRLNFRNTLLSVRHGSVDRQIQVAIQAGLGFQPNQFDCHSGAAVRYDGFLGCDGSNSEIQPLRKCCSLGGHIALRRRKWFIRKKTADNVEPDSLVFQTKELHHLRLAAVSCLG